MSELGVSMVFNISLVMQNLVKKMLKEKKTFAEFSFIFKNVRSLREEYAKF